MNSEKMALLLILQRSLFGESFSEERQRTLMSCGSLMGQKNRRVNTILIKKWPTTSGNYSQQSPI